MDRKARDENPCSSNRNAPSTFHGYTPSETKEILTSSREDLLQHALEIYVEEEAYEHAAMARQLIDNLEGECQEVGCKMPPHTRG